MLSTAMLATYCSDEKEPTLEEDRIRHHVKKCNLHSNAGYIVMKRSPPEKREG
jgi:hypothetical protein